MSGCAGAAGKQASTLESRGLFNTLGTCQPDRKGRCSSPKPHRVCYAEKGASCCTGEHEASPVQLPLKMTGPHQCPCQGVRKAAQGGTWEPEQREEGFLVPCAPVDPHSPPGIPHGPRRGQGTVTVRSQSDRSERGDTH